MKFRNASTLRNQFDGDLATQVFPTCPVAYCGGRNMNPRITLPALTLIAFLILGVGRANATFPGKNGRIAFVQWPDIYTMNPDGSDVRQLTNLGPDSGAFWQSWSPDGKEIVFIEFRPPDFLGQLWLMNADGSNQHLLLAESDFRNERPSFTPDGGSVIFTRCRLDLPDTCALYQMDVNGGGLTAITNFELGIADLDGKYSASGNRAFIGVAREGIHCAIYLGADSPSGLSPITPAALWAQMPDWSPDGKKLAFSTHCANPQNEEIWVVDAEGKTLRRLTKNGNDYFAGPHDFFPSWSPQGDAIVFERDAPDFSSFSIVIMKIDGSSNRELLRLRPSLRTKRSFDNRIHGSRSGVGKRRLKEIEEGGFLPQWGGAPN
jgi:Tol biopolymer transport system component